MDDQKYNDLRRKVLANMNTHRKRRPPAHSRTISNPEFLIPSAFAKSVMALQKDELQEIEKVLGPSPESSPTIHRKCATLPAPIKGRHSPPPEDISPILDRNHRRTRTLTAEIAACLGNGIIVKEE